MLCTSIDHHLEQGTFAKDVLTAWLAAHTAEDET